MMLYDLLNRADTNDYDCKYINCSLIGFRLF
jgi:hypothetical protein